MDIQAIRIHDTGGPEVMTLESVELEPPGPGEITVKHTAIGVNFIDTYHRSGLYAVPLPSGLGLEAAGTVAAVGEGVTRFRVGDRVAYAGGPRGAYAQANNVPAARAIALSADIDDETAASMMLKGMTAQYLLRRTFRVGPEHTVLFHAAAGGVGSIACQWAKHLGATVIGTAGSPDKAEMARAHGCDHVIEYRRQDVVDRVKELTAGRGVDVVYDGVGKDTFMASLDCLAPLGMMVSFGNASGPPPAIEPGLLATKGSLYLTRPTLFTYTRTEEELQASAEELMTVVGEGAVTIASHQRYPLAEAARAHRDLEGRKTMGAVILEP